MNSGVYQIVNIVNGHRYIGSTVDFDSRKYAHFYSLEKKKHRNCILQRVVEKYGKDNLHFCVLAKCPPEYCLKLEQWFLDNLKPEYNIALNASMPMLGRKMKESVRLQIIHRNQMRKVGEETRRKMREKKLGWRMTNEQKLKLKGRYAGVKNPNFGKKLSQDAKERISNANKGKKRTVEQLNNYPLNKKVYQYDINGNFIKEHISIGAAARSVSGDRASIALCANEKVNKSGAYNRRNLTAYGYRWRLYLVKKLSKI